MTVSRGEPRLPGCCTLSASPAPLGELPEEISRKLPRYLQSPVTPLGRLVVDGAAKGQGLGGFLLLSALHRSLTTSAQIASMAVIVDAGTMSAPADS